MIDETRLLPAAMPPVIPRILTKLMLRPADREITAAISEVQNELYHTWENLPNLRACGSAQTFF
jgi:hypothetical protein